MPIIERIKTFWTPSPVRERLLKGAFWSTIATVCSRLMLLITTYLLARMLGQKAFGEFGMINSTITVAGGLGGLGIGLTVTKNVSQYKVSDRRKAGRILGLAAIVSIVSSVLAAIVFYFSAPWIASHALAAAHLEIPLRICAITIALGILNGVQSNSLVAVEAFRTRAIVILISGAAQTFLYLVAGWYWGLTGVVVGMAISAFVLMSCHIVATNKEWDRHNLKLEFATAFKEWRVLVHFSLPLFVTLLMVGPTFWLCNSFLAHEKNGYLELGVFSAALQWQGAIQLFATLIGTALIPIMSEKVENKKYAEAFSIVKKMTIGIAIVVIPAGGILCLLSPFLMSLYGTGFENGATVMCLLIGTGTIFAIQNPMSQYIISNGLMWNALLINITWMTITLTLSKTLVHMGATGLGYGRIVGQLVQLICFYLLICHHNRKVHSRYFA